MRKARLSLWIVGGCVHQHSDASHALALLRARQQRHRRRAAKSRDELPPPHVVPQLRFDQGIW
jgi:hypothetical protein